jgi:hypothetical protein
MLPLREEPAGLIDDHPPPIAGEADTLDIRRRKGMAAEALDGIAADFDEAHFDRLSQARPLRSFSRRGCMSRRQALDFFARLLLGHANIVGGLQIRPELRARLEPVSKAERRVARNRALSLDDLGDAIVDCTPSVRHG